MFFFTWGPAFGKAQQDSLLVYRILNFSYHGTDMTTRSGRKAEPPSAESLYKKLFSNSRWDSNIRNHPHTYYFRTARRFRERRYLLVKGILPQAILEYLKAYYAILMANNRFWNDRDCPSSLSLGGDAGLDAVLEWIRPEVSRLVGFDVVPTFSYTRQYAKGEVLARHTDRAACEVSVTVSIQIPKGAGPSVVHLKPPNSNETKVEMFEGDGCVYAGTEVEHWRERFRVGGYIQLFLHFIAKRSRNYPKLMFDGRECLGSDFEKRRRKQTKKKRDIKTHQIKLRR